MQLVEHARCTGPAELARADQLPNRLQRGGVPMNLGLRFSVEGSPNSAGVAIDLIRCARLAGDRGLVGPITPAAAYFCKHPPERMPDDEAFAPLERFVLD